MSRRRIARSNATVPGQVIDVMVSPRRNAAAARAFFTTALRLGPTPCEVTTDKAPVYPRVVDEAVPSARHVTDRYANNTVEADHGRLKARLRPMRGLKRAQSLQTVAAGHAFLQNLRGGHYEFGNDRRRHCCVDRSAVKVATSRGVRPSGYRAAASSSKAMRTRSFGRRS